MSSTTIYRIGWRFLVRHPWQSILMILGITLGVAVVVSIDLANASASRAFDLSTEAVVGRATHQIVGGPDFLDDKAYTDLKLNGGVDAAAPVVTDYAASPQLGNRTLQLLGVDPFAEPPFRDYLTDKSGIPVGQLSRFLTEPGAIFLSKDVADQFGYGDCGTVSDPADPALDHCEITLDIGGQSHHAKLVGLLESEDQLSKRALDGLILTDISTAQEFTGRIGLLDRIDLILDQSCKEVMTQGNCPQIERIQSLLPADAQLQTVEARTGAVEQMTAAFRLNLTALSLLALVVGMFLIYNTMTFSVVQRRSLFGTLRCLGVTRKEIFRLIVGESLILGVLGATLGATLGTLMGQGAVRMVTQTINDLFFVLTVRGIQIPLTSLVKGGLLGILATVMSAAPPAWEAASVSPRSALTRSTLETKTQRAVWYAAALGLFLLIAGSLLMTFPTHNLIVSFAATFAIIIGFALMAPLFTKALMNVTTKLTGYVLGSLGRMAPRDVINALSRTGVAVAALMVAVSVTIGVSLMVGSFRYTVITWLEETLQGDIYISAPGLSAAQPSIPLDPRLLPIIQDWPGVRRADVLRSAIVDSPSGPVHIAATNNPTLVDERIFLLASGTPEQMRKALDGGAILVSEPLANRLGLPRKGNVITLFTEMGAHKFPVTGIYYDYASTQGTVLMTLSTYRKYWNDPSLTAASLRLDVGADPDQVTDDLAKALQPIQKLQIRPNQALREEVLVIFDRTFAITGALQILATIVAFIGILSALLSLELERQRELGILRAIGLTTRQLWSLVMVETGLMGGVAGLLAMPTGFVLAVILIYIINRRSFGWTLQMQVQPTPFLQAIVVAILAALLAGIYPALKISRTVTSEALRSE
jgi:putative ABC transport system permease protein